MIFFLLPGVTPGPSLNTWGEDPIKSSWFLLVDVETTSAVETAISNLISLDTERLESCFRPVAIKHGQVYSIGLGHRQRST